MFDSTEAALTALRAPGPYRRRDAATFLGEQPPARAVFDALLAALGDPHPEVNDAILQALVGQSTPERFEQIVAVAAEATGPRHEAALSALIEIGLHVPERLVMALSHPAPAVRQTAAHVLGDLHEAKALPGLFERLADTDESIDVRSAAAQALGEIGDTDALPALLSALAEAKAEPLRAALVAALGRLGDERAVEALRGLMTADPALRALTAQALGQLAHPDAVAELARALDDPGPATRAAVLEALIKIVAAPSGVALGTAPLNMLRPLIATPALVRELRMGVSPGSAYAASLLGWLGARESLPDLIDALGQPDEGLHQAAQETILRFGAWAQPAILAALERPEAAIREHAVELLGITGGPGAAPALILRLNDPEPAVRTAAVNALAALGSDEAYDGLLRALEDPEHYPAVIAIFGRLRDVATIDRLKHYLQRYLYEGPSTATRRWAAAQALSLFGDETAVSILLNAIRSSDETVRRPAAEALAQVRGRFAINVLIEALRDRDWLVRQKAVEALSHIPDSRAASALLTLTGDPEWRVRLTLVRALSRPNDPRVLEALRHLARDPDRWVRRAVMELCAALSHPQAVDGLRLGLQDPDETIRALAVDGLSRRRAAETLPDLLPLLEDPAPGVRAAAARACLRVAGGAGLKHIALPLHDSEGEVRRAAAEAVGELGDPEGVAAAEALLYDPVPAVRERAAEALAHIGTDDAIEALAQALPDAGAREPVRAQLRALGDRAVRELLSLARANDAALRVVAVETLGQLGDSRAAPTLRQLLSDADARVRRAAQAALKQVEA